jgi:hypothetical protein
MDKEKLVEVLKEIVGTVNDAYSSCPDDGDIGTDTSDALYYMDHARDELEKLIIKLDESS